MADPSKKGRPPQEKAASAGETGIDELTKRLEAELKKLPADKLKAAEEQVKEFVEGDVKWADLANWTPEQLHEAAKEGYRLYDTGQYAQSELIFKGLTVLDPDNYYYHQMLGACFQQLKKHPEAVVEYSIAIDLKRDDITSLTNRGEVYYNLQLWDLAEQDFDMAIRLDPKEQDRWANRARILMKKVRGLRSSQTGAAPEKK